VALRITVARRYITEADVVDVALDMIESGTDER
jgi:hypothetical protein